MDDGSSFSKDDLKGVTERHIKEIARVESDKGINLEIVTESYLDQIDKKVVLLRKTTSHFSKEGNLIKKILSSSDGTLTSKFEYKYAAGKLISIKDPEGREEFFEYDKQDRLIMKKGPRLDLTKTFHYDAQGRIIEESERFGLSELKTRYKYDALGRKISIINPQGAETQVQYDLLARVTYVQLPSLRDVAGKLSFACRQYSYDKLGMEVTETDELGVLTKKFYNVYGKITKVIYADRSREKFSYDLIGRLVEYIGADNVGTKYSYDCFDNPLTLVKEKANRVFSQVVKSYNAFHELTSKGPTQEETLFSYDGAGRMSSSRKLIDTNNYSKTTYAYDDFDRKVEERRYVTHVDYIATLFTYDSLGRVLSEKIVDRNNQTHSNKTFSYDKEGNRNATFQTVDDRVAMNNCDFYPHGIPEKVVDPVGNTTYFEIDYTYENPFKEKVIKKTTHLPQSTKIIETFNALGLLETSEHIDSKGRKIKELTNFYDPKGQLIVRHERELSDDSSALLITSLKYDALGRLISVSVSSGTQETKTTTFLYSIENVNYLTIYPQNRSLVKYFDQNERIESLSDDKNTIQYNYTYDPSGRVIKAKNRITERETQRRYNGLGLITSETLESGLTLNYEYDLLGRIVRVELPDQSYLVYSYNPVHLQKVERILPSGKVQFCYEVMKRNMNGNIVTAKLPGIAGTLNYSYNLLGKMMGIEHKEFSLYIPGKDYPLGISPIGMQVEDSRGQETITPENAYKNPFVKNFTSKLKQSTFERGCQDEKESTFTFDSLLRLTRIEKERLLVEYRFDPFGRRIKKVISGEAPSREENYIYLNDQEIGTIENGEIKELCIFENGMPLVIELQGKVYAPITDPTNTIRALISAWTGDLEECYRYRGVGEEKMYSDDEELRCSQVKNPWRFLSKRNDEESGLLLLESTGYDPHTGKPISGHDNPLIGTPYEHLLKYPINY